MVADEPNDLSIARQLAAPPMLFFRRVGFGYRLRAMQRQHHSDVSMYQRAAIFRRHNDGLAGGLPLRASLFHLRKLQASIERDTDPTRLSPDNVTMVIAVLCVDYQVE